MSTDHVVIQLVSDLEVHHTGCFVPVLKTHTNISKIKKYVRFRLITNVGQIKTSQSLQGLHLRSSDLVSSTELIM